MKSTLSAKQEEKARLERDKSNVSPDQQLQYLSLIHIFSNQM